jgi:hypothetical protein
LGKKWLRSTPQATQPCFMLQTEEKEQQLKYMYRYDYDDDYITVML